MVLNSMKTKVMLIITKQKRLRLQNTNLNLQYMDETHKMISNDKILGVCLDNNLSWSDHVKHVCKKISSYSGVFRKSRTSYHKHIVCNSINRISNLILTSAILCGAILVSLVKWKYLGYKSVLVGSFLTTMSRIPMRQFSL